MRRIAAAIAAVAACLPAVGEAQIILGRVMEEGTRTPVAGASITLLRVDGSTSQQTISDSLGVFRVVSAAPGNYALRVTHLAFTPLDSAAIDLAPGETVSLEIRLAAARIALDPIVVTARTTNSRLAGFHERRVIHAFGRFVTREEIDRRSAAKATDLLRGVPGVTIVQVRNNVRAGPARNLVMMRGTLGTCEPALYIDGLRVNQSAQSSMDDVLSPSSLEGVEVYTSAAGAPAQYADPRACGVVLFWTRAGEGSATPWNWKRLLVGAGAVLAVLLLAR